MSFPGPCHGRPVSHGASCSQEAMNMSDMGIVTIGRNEGERLRRCLDSLVGRGLPWSTSIPTRPTAVSSWRAPWAWKWSSWTCRYRSRRASSPQRGFRAAAADRSGYSFCSVRRRRLRDCRRAGWTAARQALEDRPDVAVVYGRRRERFRETSIYNRLADLEWDMPDRGGLKPATAMS